jgi:EAL domain-containing protein (putative c-di-GMP-specific phosphodiesterase class I)
LEIDQAFVRNILVNPGSVAVRQAIVSLSRSIGLTVTAEGVETEAQRDYLADLGCHSYQGLLVQRTGAIGGVRIAVSIAAFVARVTGVEKRLAKVSPINPTYNICAGTQNKPISTEFIHSRTISALRLFSRCTPGTKRGSLIRLRGDL